MSELVRNETICIAQPKGSQDMFEIMEKAYKFSKIMAESDIIPAHYRGKASNVFIAIQTAYRMNLVPMLVMQNTYVYGGKLGMNSSLAIALANTSGLFAGSIGYEVKELDGELERLISAPQGKKEYNKPQETKEFKEQYRNIEVTAYATLKFNREKISYTIGMKEAIAEGWASNPKYKSLPELMLRYRAATLLIRTHIPEVINGMHMVEEIEDVVGSKEVNALKPSVTSKLDQFLEAEESKPEDQIEFLPEEVVGVTEVTEATKTLAPENIFTSEEEKLNEQSILYSELSKLIETQHIPQKTIEKWCKAAGVNTWEELGNEKIQSCIKYIQDKDNTALLKI